MFGFVGPNGAGKTTTMRIILGVLGRRPRRGAVPRLPGRLRDAAALRLHAGGARAVSQDAGPRPARLPRPPARARRRRRAESADEPWIERLGLTERAGRPRRAALARQPAARAAGGGARPRARAARPRRAVLRARSGRRRRARAASWATMRQRGVPVVFSSHQLELVERLCQAVAIIKDGRLVASGSVEELRSREEPTGAACGWRSPAPRATTGRRRRRAPRW